MDPNHRGLLEDLDWDSTDPAESAMFLDEFGAEELLGQDIDLESPSDWDFK
jgi:hypothetical protein